MCEVLDRAEMRGEKRGHEEINRLCSILLEQDQIDDLRRAVHDMDYQNQLMAEYDIGDTNE